MDLQFAEKPLPYLRQVARDIKNVEQTLEIRVPDSAPRVGTILGVWGQVTIRGKEWHGDRVTVNGGVVISMLYLPDGEDGVQVVDGWIPFQQTWDLEDSYRDGKVIVSCVPRIMDGRSISAGKVLVRVSLSICAEVYEDDVLQIPDGADIPEDVQTLCRQYPLCMPIEAGEKLLSMEEDLALPGGSAPVERVLHCRLCPVITDQKMMADKVVFRGTYQLRMLYTGQDGQIHVYDSEIPVSQYIQLEGEYGQNGYAVLTPAVTELESLQLEDGKVRIKCGLIAQYVVYDTKFVSVMEDAYSNERTVEIQKLHVPLPQTLEQQDAGWDVKHSIPAEAVRVIDCVAGAAHHRQNRVEDQVELTVDGTVQLLYVDEDDRLRGACSPFEFTKSMTVGQNSQLLCISQQPEIVRVVVEPDHVEADICLRGKVTAASVDGMEFVCGLRLSESGELPDDGPNLVVCRAFGRTLWELAKENRSTVAAIQAANALESEPADDRLLLIPVS